MNSFLARLSAMTMQRALIVAALIGAFYFFTMFDDGSSFDQKIKNVDNEISNEDKKAKASDEAIKKLEQIRSSIATLQDQFKLMAQQLPTETNASEILKTVDTLAKSAGIGIKLKEPREAKKEDFVEALPLHLRLQGTYSEITMFLYYVSIMERITRLRGFSLEKVANSENEKLKSGTLVFDGEIMSYRYLAAAPPLNAKEGVKK